jgi:hypothetical protein
MRTPDISRARLARVLAVDRNELRRASDRIEAWSRLALIIAFVPLAVLAALVAGRWVHDASARELRPGQQTREVTAVLVSAAPAGQSGAVWYWTPARWTEDGVTHRGNVPAVAGTSAGSTVPIWIDAAGRVQQPPLTYAQVTSRMVVALVVSSLAVAIVLWLAWRLLRWRLDRRRLARWDEAWSQVGPLWTR